MKTISEKPEQLLLEGTTAIDEYNRLRDSVELKSGNLQINYGPDLFKCSFDDDTRRILALIEEHHQLEKILDASHLSDLETLRLLLVLMKTRLVFEKND